VTFPRSPLGDVLELRRPDVPVDGSARYQFAGVKSFGAGVFRSVAKDGSSFAYKTLSRLHTGDFVYPKLMAWEGALGVVPENCDGLYVSPEFCVFTVDRRRVDPRWLDLYFQQPGIWPLLVGGSAGTNVRRRRLHPRNFLRLEFPLPSMDVQRDVLGNVDVLLNDLATVRASHDASRTALNAALLAAYHHISDRANRRPLREVAPLVRRSVDIDFDSLYLELGVRSFGRGTFHKPGLRGADIGNKRLFEIHPGDLVFNIVFAWEGAVAVAVEDDTGRVGSHRFLTCVAAPEEALAEYLCFHFLTQAGLRALGEASPGGAGRNRTLGLQALAAIDVPVPAIDQQRRFVEMLRLRADFLTRLEALHRNCDALKLVILKYGFDDTLRHASPPASPAATRSGRRPVESPPSRSTGERS